MSNANAVYIIVVLIIETPSAREHACALCTKESMGPDAADASLSILYSMCAFPTAWVSGQRHAAC